MINQKFTDIYTAELANGAIIHDAYIGFKEDYLILHCLLRKYKPLSVWETGTNIGSGLNVICNALPEADVYSLDLDYETMRLNSKQYPLDSDGTDRVGTAAKFPYTQLRGDSMKFDYSKYPCEGYWIDGEHDFEHPFHETKEVLKLNPKIIIWHDSNIPEVYKAIVDAFKRNTHYDLYRVTDTRIAYALKK